jgi:isopenicillin N synthase-like dioxygenase
MLEEEDIPIIDLSNPSTGDRGVHENQLAHNLVHAFRTYGFATLIHHGVTSMASAFRASRQFFDLPLEIKRKYKYRSHASNRGYLEMGSESHSKTHNNNVPAKQPPKPEWTPDCKETFDIGKEAEDSDDQTTTTPWPTELSSEEDDPNFQRILLQYFQECDALHLRLLKWIGMGLGLPDPDFFVNQCNEQHCNLRLLHYPELSKRQEQPNPSRSAMDDKDSPTTASVMIRGACHTDFGTITLVAQDSVGGLQIQKLGPDNKPHWITVKPIPGALVVNIGEMLQYVMNDSSNMLPTICEACTHKLDIFLLLLLLLLLFPDDGPTIFCVPHRTES